MLGGFAVLLADLPRRVCSKGPQMGEISLVEWLTLCVDALVPFALAIFAVLGKRYVDSLERRRIAYGVSVSWRMDTFRELAKNLNILMQFHCYVGDWSELTPNDAREAKRRCDELVFGNRFLWSDEFMTLWQRFNNEVFVENRGAGTSFLLRANVERYRSVPGWQEEWRAAFVPCEERIRRTSFRRLIDEVLRRAATEVGVVVNSR